MRDRIGFKIIISGFVLIFITGLSCKPTRTNPKDTKSDNFVQGTLSISTFDIPSTIPEEESAVIGIKLSGVVASGTEVLLTSDNGAITVNGDDSAVLVFSSNDRQNVTLSATEDANLVNETATITVSCEFAEQDEVFDVSSVDIDVQNILLTGATSVEEGSTSDINVRLSQEPASNVTVALASDNAAVTVTGSPLTFSPANYSVNQTVTLNGVEEDVDEDSESVTITASADGIDDAIRNIVTIENDTKIIFDGATSVYEGETAVITVALSGNPGIDRTVSLSSSDESKVTLDTATVDFTTANATTPQNVTINGVIDPGHDDDTITITGSWPLDDNTWDITFNSVPVVLSTTPADDATGVDPTDGTITIVFSHPMNNGLTPSLKVLDTDVNVDHTETAWSQTTVSDDTLTFTIGWVYFPEDTEISWKVSATEVQDTNGKNPSADITGIFTTTKNHVVYQVPDTGQTSCFYDNTTTWVEDAACSETYSVGSTQHPYGQDSHYPDKPNVRSYDTSVDGIITDNVTGLVWKECTEGQTGSDCTGNAPITYTWPAAFNACAALNDSSYGGITDWRLPTQKEWMTIIDYGKSTAPLIDDAFIETQTDRYWTSNAYSQDYSVDINFGATDEDIIYNRLRSSELYVRCVSDGSEELKSYSYTDNEDGTVTDNATGLIWQKCLAGYTYSAGYCYGTSSSLTWMEAMEYCENATTGLETNWRLPSYNEMVSLYNSTQPQGQDTSSLSGSHSLWSSTSVPSLPGRVWTMSFSTFYVTTHAKTDTFTRKCRCVYGP